MHEVSMLCVLLVDYARAVYQCLGPILAEDLGR